MRVALIQLAYGEGSEESVEERASRAADLVREVGPDHDLVVLPELWSAGGFAIDDWQERSQDLEAVRAAEHRYGHATVDRAATGDGDTTVDRDATVDQDATVDGDAAAAGGPGWPPALVPLVAAAREVQVVLHTGSVVERTVAPGEEGRHLSNTSVVLGPDGGVCATYRKIHRFGFGSGEPRLMEAGTELVVADLPAPADALTVGLSTCYDLRFPELYRAQLDLGAELFVVPAAWPAARVEAWRLLARARAIEDQCFVLACNTAGTHAGVEMGGYSAVIDPWGTVLAEAGTEQEILSVRIDPGAVAKAREKFPVLADRRL